MPNWCENMLTISGDEEAIQQFKALLSTTEHEGARLSFNALLPLPKDKEDDWYDWQIQNWGTKWDVIEDGEGLLPFDENESLLEYGFDTAWGPPIELLKNITMRFPRLSFRLGYAEPGMCFAGVYEIKGGEEINVEHYTTMEEVNNFGESFFGMTYYEQEDFEEDED